MYSFVTGIRKREEREKKEGRKKEEELKSLSHNFIGCKDINLKLKRLSTPGLHW